MHERIKKLRKALDLTQREFGERIGVKPNTIATYEIGRNSPIDAVISLICREFRVNETWLRTGEGEMFEQTEETIIERLCSELCASDLEAKIIRAYFRLDPRIREPFMNRLIAEMQSEFSAPAVAAKSEPAAPTSDTSGQEMAELDADGLRPVSAEFEAEARAKAELYYQRLLSEQERENQARFANGFNAGCPLVRPARKIKSRPKGGGKGLCYER